MSPDGANRMLGDRAGEVAGLLPDPQDPADEFARARLLLREEGRRRADAAAAAVKAVMEKYRCRMSTRQEWVDGQPTSPPQVIIVPVD